MKHVFLAFVGYTLFALFLFFPLFRHPFSTVPDDYDGIFVTWTIQWVAQHFTQPKQLFDAPIFSPYHYTLTFSDPFFTAAAIAAPFLILTGEPLAGFTVNMLFALVGTAVFSYLLVHELTQNKTASFLSGLVISFGVTHLHYIGHLHMLMVQFIPLGLWAWRRYTQTYKKRFLLLFLASFLAQSLNSPFTTYLFLFALLLFSFDPDTYRTLKQKWKIILAGGVFSLGTLLLCYFPYLQSAQLYHSYRTIRDAAHFSLSVNELFSPRRISLIFLFFMILLIGKRWKEGTSLTAFIKGCVLIFGIGILFSLGPVLKWKGQTVKVPFPVPLPYAAAHYVLPGFKAFRTPSRWLILSHVALFLLMGLLLRPKKKNLVLVPLFLIVLTLEAQPFQEVTSFPQTIEYPEAYSWLATQPIHAVAHLPPYTYDMPNAKQETHRMLFSSQSPSSYSLYNGYSGFAPQERMDEINYFHDHPLSVETGKRLVNYGIDFVVIHTFELKPSDQPLLYELRKEAFYNDLEYVIVPPAHIRRAQCW